MSSTRTRTPPARVFENYTFTRVLGGPDAGLTPVSIDKFKPCSPGVSYLGSADPGAGSSDDGYSVPIPIGFDFSFDNTTYKYFTVNTNGWMVLTTTGSFAPLEVLINNDLGNLNTEIRPTFQSNAALLSPWWDDLVNMANDLSQLKNYSATKLGRVQSGFEPPLTEWNQAQYGVRYFNVPNSRNGKGRATVVRWNSLSNYAVNNTNLRFEVVVYENGDIEFRYAPRSALTIKNNPGVESACIGIFMGNGTNRFRDFSQGLGYVDNERIRPVYTYGGYVYSPSFNDIVKGTPYPYVASLTPYRHWPGNATWGCTMAFKAPSLRRRVLPRLSINERDAQITMPLVSRVGDVERLGTDNVFFDARNVATFMTGASLVVNYPTVMPRLFGSNVPGIIERQNLFNNGIEVTASISKPAADPYLIERPRSYIKPFCENKLPEQNVNSLNDYFASGSRVSQFGTALDQRLQSKTIIRMSMPVERTIVMPATSSAIMYYRPHDRSWAVPTNASYIIGSAATTNNSGLALGDIQDPRDSVYWGRVLEDTKGFGPIGNRISSGSANNVGTSNQTNPNIGNHYAGTTLDRESLANAVLQTYSKSVSLNPQYQPTRDETFSLPITKPFLLEKMVIELPVAMGDGWFKNITTSFEPINAAGALTRAFDFAGPALTLSLFNQVKAGSGTRLDLILTGTITHNRDDMASITSQADALATNMYRTYPIGYRSFGGRASAVVSPSLSSSITGFSFTGSVGMNLEAGVSNGVIVQYGINPADISMSFVTQPFRNLFASPTVMLNNEGTYDSYNGVTIPTFCSIASINPLGRGATGFGTSIRSPFGKEYPTFSSLINGTSAVNPFYITGSNPNLTGSNSGLPTHLESVLATVAAVGNMYIRLVAAIPIIEYRPSPYIVNPGDKLVLALSKVRPFFYLLSGSSEQTANEYTSGSIVDDVQLITGTINVTFYGSTLSENAEHHDTLNQPLASNAVHELFIGGPPTVDDQFVGDYRDAYSGSYNDEVVAGTMDATQTWNGTAGTLGRGVIFSKSAPRSAPYNPGLGPFDHTSSLSIQSQPYFELAGTHRYSTVVSSTERIWDSMMPAIDQCIKIDGSQIVKPSSQALSIATPNMVSTQIGLISFSQIMSTNGIGPGDSVWPCAYPYEPRYASVARQADISKSFIVSAFNDAYVGVTQLSSPVPVKGLIIDLQGSPRSNLSSIWQQSVVMTEPTYLTIVELYWADIIISGNVPYVTGAMSTADTIKTLYGFGDCNNMQYRQYSGSFGGGFLSPPYSPIIASGTVGFNHFAEMRKLVPVQRSDWNWIAWAVSPIIRGWKYGVYSGLPAYTQASFRTDRFGQFRDMLEQRPYTKLFNINDPDLPTTTPQGVGNGVVSVRFVDSMGNLTAPENTWSSNLSTEATSSIPYVDGVATNRPTINTKTLNTNVMTLGQDQFGNVRL